MVSQVHIQIRMYYCSEADYFCQEMQLKNVGWLALVKNLSNWLVSVVVLCYFPCKMAKTVITVIQSMKY